MFSAGTEIERRSRVGALATKNKGTWTAWSITRKRRKKEDNIK